MSKTSTGARVKNNSARRVFDYLKDIDILKIEKGKSIMDYFKITKRCIRCRKPLREDGTCQNPKCVRYKAPKEQKAETNTTAESK